jgi:Putative transposase/Transposase zinc-binding domain
MTSLNDIFRQYGSAYRAQYAERLLPSHRTALAAIEGCRTEAMGGHVYSCSTCGTTRYSYHSCKNRHCPRCQQDTAQAWLARQQDLLLPVPYFLLTFTLPPALRELVRQHQRLLYSLLFHTSAAALQQLAHDPRFLGGQIGLLGVLQTWTRDLRFHPHVHYLVPALALAADGTLRRPRNPAFLVPVKALALLFRAKLRAALRQTELYRQVPTDSWRQAWVVDCRPIGSGAAALKYLAPYIFRVALSNNRIVGVRDDQVTFRYRDGETKQVKLCTLPALSFMGRFLQHVLPKGFVKVRYYGFFSPRQRHVLGQLRQRLLLATSSTTVSLTSRPSAPVPAAAVVLCCAVCGQPMLSSVLRPVRSRGPPAAPRGGQADDSRGGPVHAVWPAGRRVRHVQQQSIGLNVGVQSRLKV